MKINSIKATNMELTPAISDYARKRVDTLDKVVREDDESASISIEVGKTTRHHKEGDLFRTELNLHVAGKDFRSVAEKDDLYASIDEAKDQIFSEVSHWGDKRRTMIRRGGAIIKDMLRGIGDFSRGIPRRIGGRIRNFHSKFRRGK